MRVHYTDSYLLNPQHKITICLAGAGGTGSQMLSALARINEALTSFDHPGLHVKCYDHDTVSAANIGRQLFSQADIGINKSIVLINRINRFFGYNWEAHPEEFITGNANIIITCIDSAAGRIKIGNEITKKQSKVQPHYKRLYWLDLGNLRFTGQVVLGTLANIGQPKSEHETIPMLPIVTKKFDLENVNEKDQGPSCSLAEAINKQDLFINSTLAQLGANLIWKLFREGMIQHYGCYLNLQTLNVNPIKI